MAQDTNLLNFIIALVGVIGTGIGIAASLIPMELIGKRDAHQRMVKVWRLLFSETQRIRQFCTDLAQCLEQAVKMMTTNQVMPKKYLNRISLGGLQAILLADSEFISQAPPTILGKLFDAYHCMSLANETMNDYSHYIATAEALWELGAVKNQSTEFYTLISTNCRSIVKWLEELEQPLVNEANKAEKKERSIQMWITILKWLGGVVFVGVVAALAFLAYVYIRH